MPRTENKCFDIAISLVQQHDKDDLLTTFQIILQKQFPDCQLNLILIKDNQLPTDNSKNKELLSQCMLSRETFYSPEQQCFIFPVISLGKITHILSLQGNSLASQQEKLKQLTVLFSNQQLLLDNNNHDALTGLLNRHCFEKRLAHAVSAQQRRNNENNSHYCFALLDIDFFKKVNDNFGHLYGDEVLILFANIMEKTFRHNDMLFRYGGEEFAVLLSDINLETATLVLERFRKDVAGYPFPQVGSIHVSIGITEINTDSNREKVISQADQALYYSKNNGRNQVNSYETLLNQRKIIPTTPYPSNIEIF